MNRRPPSSTRPAPPFPYTTLFRSLDGGPDDAPAVPEGAILVADDLLPSQLMALDTRPAGIALARGGATSHVAIIAAGMGVPMAIGLGPALGQIGRASWRERVCQYV